MTEQKATQEIYNVPVDLLDSTKDIEIKFDDLERQVYTIDYYQHPDLNKDITL